MKRILFVVTNHKSLGKSDQQTGLWLEEFAAPYYILKEQGYSIAIASVSGGKVPLDPASLTESAQTSYTKRYLDDPSTQHTLNHSQSLKEVTADDFDAVYFPGGHGLLWDLIDETFAIDIIEHFNKSRKPMAFVCHGVAVLKNVLNKDAQPLVHGKKVTGFSNAEEIELGLEDQVPFLLEDMLKENGGMYTAKKNWTPHVVVDGNLITGQNPASSEKVALAIIELLN